MDDSQKTRAQLLLELADLRQQLQAHQNDHPSQNANEANLHEQEEYLRQLAETIQEVYWLRDHKTSQLLYVSPAYEQIWGRSIQSLIEEPDSFSQAAHPDDAERIALAIQRQQADGLHFDDEYRIITPDGAIRWIHARTFAVRDENGEIYRWAGVAQDITARRQAENRLHESEERYRALFEQAPDAIVLIDPETTRFVQFNAQTYQNLGYTPDEFSELTISDVEAVETNSETAQRIRSVMASGTATFETQHRTKQGDIRNVLISTCRISLNNRPLLQSIWTDITEQQQMMAQLRKANRALAMLGQCRKAIATVTDEQTLLESICDIIVRVGGYRLAWIGYATDDAEKSITPMAWSGIHESYLDTLNLSWQDSPAGQGPSGRAVRENRVVMTQNILTDPIYEHWREAAFERGYLASVALPMPEFGVLHVYATDIAVFSEDACALLTELVSDLLTSLKIMRLQSQQAMTEAQIKQLSTAVEQSPTSIVITDLQGNIEYVNPKFTQVTGYHLSEVLGKNPRILKSGYTSDHEYANLWAKISAGEEWRGEFHNQRKDGSFFWELASISPITNKQSQITHYIAVKEDITERKTIEESLNLRNQELISLYRAAHVLTSTLDMERLFTMLLEEIRNLLNVLAASVWLVDPQTEQIVCRQATEPHYQIIRDWALPLGTGLVGWAIEHNEHLIVPDATKDNRHYPEIDKKTGLSLRSILTVPLCVQDTVIGALQLVDIDADRFQHHDLMLAESLAAIAAHAIQNALLFANLQETQQQLVESEKLSILGQMAATVAHELRNPLMAVRMGVDYLTRDLPPDNPRQLGAQLMRTNMRRIDRLVEDILFMVRKQQADKELVLLTSILKAELEHWSTPLKEGKITLVADIDVNLMPLNLNADLISRAVGNLINNRADFLPAGGVIKITLQDGEDSQKIIVEDNGPVISKAHLEHIFEPFLTTRSRGTGIGLSIVKQIIEMHDGQIEVWSKPNQGTKFTIILPLPY